MIRSMLFVPADSERKLNKSLALGADALVFDLEDAVLPERKPLARQMLQAFFAAQPDHQRFWVRINDLHSGELLKDLPAVIAMRPAGIVLPKIRGPKDLHRVSHYMEALEAAQDLPPGGIKLLPVVTETPIAVLRLAEMAQQSLPRLCGLMWGAEDLSSAMAAGDPRDEKGAWRSTYEYARVQCLIAAHAMGVQALDTVYVNFRDPQGLQDSCRVSRHDGFTGRVAIHPDQLDIINTTFSPSEEELQLARRVVAAFESGAGAVAIDGKMYDIPHLKAARRLLER